jgi:site-specific DNA-methyltransferase (adenine-specific)
MGKAELYNGDCLEVMDRLIEKGIKVDAIITDPPYGTTDIKGWDKIIPQEQMWVRINKLIKNDGTIALFGSQPFSSFLICSNPKMFRYEWIWDKTRGSNFLNANCQPMKSHENILIFSILPTSPNNKGVANYYPQKVGDVEYVSKLGKRTKTYNGGEVEKVETTLKGYHPKTIQTFKKDGTLHPTQKPVLLIEHLIKSYTNEGETVLDFTMGSGTTGVACINTNRNFIGIELDKTYFNIAKDRIEKVGLLNV